MSRVTHLEAIESVREERLHPLARPIGAGMREDGEPAGVVDERDRVRHADARLGNEGRAPSPQVAVERIAKVGRPSVRHERARHVWSPDGAPTRLLEHRVQRDGNAERVEHLDDPLGACAARLTKVAERALERLELTEVQPEHVDLAVVLDRAQLDAGDDTHAQPIAGGPRLVEAGQRVVIGERDDGEPRGVSRFHDRGRRRSPVGRRRVHVQVDEALGASAGRLRHGAYPASGEVTLGCDIAKSRRRSASDISLNDCSRHREPSGE